MSATFLFDLIQSMSPAERSYFQRFAHKQSSGESSQYLNLFSFLCRMKSYDEEKLKKEIKRLGIKTRPAAAKNYLYNLILHSLVECHAGKTPQDKLLRLLREIELLKEKNLTEQARKKIHSAVRIAREEEFYEELALLINHERTLVPFVPKTFGERTGLLEEMEKVLEEKLNYVQYRRLVEEMLNDTYLYGWLLKGEEERTVIRRKLEHPLLRDENAALTFLAKYNMMYIRVSYHMMLAEWEEAVHWSGMRRDLFRRFPKYKEKWQQNYLVALDNHLRLLVTAGDFSDFDDTVKELEAALPTVKDAQERSIRQMGLLLAKMNRLVHANRYEEALIFADQLTKLEKIKHYNPGMLIGRNFFVARAWFFGGNYDKALEWLLQSRNDTNLSIYPDFQFYTELLHCLTHYHLGNHWLLESLSRSVQRLFTKLNRAYLVEKELVHFIPKLLNLQVGKDRRDAIQQLIPILENLRQDPTERLAFHYFDYLQWAEKASGRH